jgi:spermidine synthase
MRYWDKLGEAPIPGTSGRLELFRGKDDFFIRTATGVELMSTRKHGSEDALGAQLCRPLRRATAPQVLVGGLGMGFTLAAALAALGPTAVVTVAELVPGVIDWNRGPLGEAAGRPLDDPRTKVYEGDVAELLERGAGCFDAIALDVDNGPEGITTRMNDRLYSEAGLSAIRLALAPAGRVGFWSAGPDPTFGGRLRRSGARVEEVQAFAHGNKGARHTLWFAQWISNGG